MILNSVLIGLLVIVSAGFVAVMINLGYHKAQSEKKDKQIKMLMERIWNLKKVIKDNGLI
jgi:hypothetical protein